MKILVDKQNGIIEWNYKGKDIYIKNLDIMYAFSYGKEMIMLKTRNKNGEVKFYFYENTGDFVMSYINNTGDINLNGQYSICINDLITVEYSKDYKKIIVLVGKEPENRQLIILDDKLNIVANLSNPPGYIYYSTKNIEGEILVVCQGTSDTSRDKYGRNDWNFKIDLNNYCVKKVSITQ